MSLRLGELAGRMACRGPRALDGFVRETRDEARVQASTFLKSYPKAAYMSVVERWRELPGAIEFAMRRRRTAE
jgi:hypothetical protein